MGCRRSFTLIFSLLVLIFIIAQTSANASSGCGSGDCGGRGRTGGGGGGGGGGGEGGWFGVCGDFCERENDCTGMLSCIDEQCSDDPDMGTHICEARKAHDDCKPFGYLVLGPDAIPSSVDCQDSNLTKCCCKSGHLYPQFACSPPISNFTKGILTLRTFKPLSNNRSRCGAPAPDDHSVLYGDGDGDEGKKKKLVSLSTGWFEKGSRCFKQVEIKGNGKTTVALVVDECDTQNGCDEESAYQPPCPLPNIVSASKAVWTALGVLTCDDDDGSSCSSDPRFGWMDITWSDIIDDVHEDQAASLHLSAA